MVTSNVPATAPVQTSAGWGGQVVDGLTGLMGAYFTFEREKAGLELLQAQNQQRRLEDAVSVDQQVNNMVDDKQNRDQMADNDEQQGSKTLLYLGAGALALVALLVLKK